MAKKKQIRDGQDGALTVRENQVMDIVYAERAASARDIHEKLADPPTYSTVRTLFGVLERKGHLLRQKDGRRFVYTARRQREKAADSALRRIVETFFDGSVGQAVSGLLNMKDQELGSEDIARIERKIEEAKPNR